MRIIASTNRFHNAEVANNQNQKSYLFIQIIKGHVPSDFYAQFLIRRTCCNFNDEVSKRNTRFIFNEIDLLQKFFH